MQSSLSFILNIVLLIGVVGAIVRMMRTRRQNAEPLTRAPSIGVAGAPHNDDIISVRKVTQDEVVVRPILQTGAQYSKEPQLRKVSAPTIEVALDSASTAAVAESKPQHESEAELETESISTMSTRSSAPIMMFLLAKANRQLAGYELLQAVLAAGLRFGEGQLFHRHQSSNGQGTIMCSLAAATATGVFDLQNIGAFVVRGLCLFMEASGNPTIDEERFEIMLDTAKKLSEGLDTYILDDRRQPLSDESIRRYHELLNLSELSEQPI